MNSPHKQTKNYWKYLLMKIKVKEIIYELKLFWERFKHNIYKRKLNKKNESFPAVVSIHMWYIQRAIGAGPEGNVFIRKTNYMSVKILPLVKGKFW